MDTNTHGHTTEGISSLLFDADPARVEQVSQQHPFDVIVIGSGMGGGVLAHSLADHHQRVLLLERGDLIFTTHSLNTTRPKADLSRVGPTQDNDIVYGLLKEKVKVTEDSDTYAGGPLYCVGGRSNAWGLYIPRIDHDTLEEYFPPSVANDLRDNKDPKKANYYKRAEYMMRNKDYKHDKAPNAEPFSVRERVQDQVTKILKDQIVSDAKDKALVDSILKALNNSESQHSIDVKPIAAKLRQDLQGYSSNPASLELAELHWALLGAQWSSEDRYEFPQGAFSTTDRILEAVFNTHKNTSNKLKPPFLTCLHNSLVVELSRENDIITKVKTITATGAQHSFIGKKIVVCAGAIDSPALLLRSGIIAGENTAKERKEKEDGRRKIDPRGDDLPKYAGITDHNIYGFRFNVEGGGEISPAKLQIEGAVSRSEPTKEGKFKKIPFLLNLCINANSFLARGFEDQDEESACVCTITYEFRAPINTNNFVALDVYTGEPIIHIKNSGEEVIGPNGKLHPHVEKTLSELNVFIEERIRAASKLGGKSQLREGGQVWKAAGLGCVAHEIGTLPMSKNPSLGVVDDNLKFHNIRNLYVCDMSVMPVSAPANPSLTLVALALRLADHIIAQKKQDEMKGKSENR